MTAETTRPPLATYRVQLRAGFGFARIAELAGYFADLGVSHLYLSPCFQAAPRSQHGYDVVDYRSLNRELGDQADFDRMCERLAAHGLGLVFDLVPNHMALDPDNNHWLRDVLARGPDSEYAQYFDIDWRRPGGVYRGKLVLPILGERRKHMLAGARIRLGLAGTTPVVNVDDRTFPLSELSLAEACRDLGLAYTDPLASQTAAELVRRLNESPDRLGRLLAAQHYALVYHQDGAHLRNYRRFFDIDHLIALRIELDDVFRDVHALLSEWLQSNIASGLRIDHVDGLRDPESYLKRLRALAPETWIVVEKILERGEKLKPDWPVQGSTGYDFLNEASSLFVDPHNAAACQQVWQRFAGKATDFAPLVYEQKKMVLESLFAGELEELARRLSQLMGTPERPATRFKEVVHELIACLPVYRTYATHGQPLDEADRLYLQGALDEAEQRLGPAHEQVTARLRELFGGRFADPDESAFMSLFQQLSGPAMAKGLEDTALYRHQRLLCLNEVGGDPDRFGTEPQAFHDFCMTAARTMPASMLATSTHDTKRSEDTRLRIAMLSEMPQQWSAAVQRWSEQLRPRRQAAGPDRAMEYHFYQTLVGVFPASVERVRGYMLKAARESKHRTRWRQRDREYEAALGNFVEAAFSDREFMADVERFVASLLPRARIASLALTLLKLTAPGVPDIYQGTEEFADDLVDPDNRRPIDFEALERRLRSLPEQPTSADAIDDDRGLSKLLVVTRGLGLRREHARCCFSKSAGYQPLWPEGDNARHAVAFQRGPHAITVVPRLMGGLDDGWGDTRLALPEERLRDVLTGQELDGGTRPLSTILEHFPVALLVPVAA